MKRFTVFMATISELSESAGMEGGDILRGIITSQDRPPSGYKDLFTYVQNATKGEIFRPSKHTAIVCTQTR